MRRVLIYALVYGSIGALVGVCVALYTQDVDVTILPKSIILKNGSATKSSERTPQSSEPSEEVAESPTQYHRED
jgi:hypothetical protein